MDNTYETDEMFIVFGQVFGTMISDLKLEIMALRQVLAEKGVEEEVLNQRLNDLRFTRLTFVTAETNNEIKLRIIQYLREFRERST